ncbi:MAG: PPC domain-containing protein, partial [Deltaproteobacteria bacterium]|nr:PPC domain-containing protein [Deltaproteobacteria bacterium]
FVRDASYVGDKGPFTFTLTFAVPPATEAVCHDGIDNDVDGAADCQDGDCVADLYCLDLYEPNDTLPTAYGLGDLSGSAFTTGGATISPATLDADYFRFTLQSDHALDITLTPSGGLDGKITLLNAAGVALLSADAGGINVAETLATDLAGPGTYHVLVAGYGITKGSYVLGLVLTPLEEFDCDDGVNEDGDATTDCCDPDCAAAAPCLQESHCLDGFDDDCDGQADCDDQDCGGTPACGGADDCLDAFPVNGGLPLDGTLDGQILEEWGSTVGYADDFQGSCDGDSAAAPDAVWILTVAERVAVNAGMDYQGVMWPAVYLTDAPCGTGAELGCGAATGGWAWTGDVVLEPGTYYLIVDGAYAGDEEIYTLQVEVSAVYDTEVDCGDGEDEDFDGLADCCDTDCLGADACKEVCGDGLDNDCDTVADCCDDDCGGDAACAAEGDCLDGEDGDCDGLLDCGDWDCAAVAECAGEGCAAAEALNGGAAITAADDGLQLVVNGDTAPARNDHAGSCDADTGTAADLAFTFQVAAPIGVSVTHDFVSPVLWPAVYLYDGVCNAEGELACDATSGDAAFIAPILLQPGTYYVIVDSSWPTDAGEFTLTLDFSLPDATETSCTDGLDNDLNGATDCADETCALDPECLGESCLTALELNNGAGISAADDGLHLEVVGDTSGAKPDLEGSCDADSAEASDQVYTFVLDDPMGVQISHDFDGYNWPMVYLFQESCDAADEVACAFLNGEAPAVIPFTALEPGTYYLVVDSSYATDAGPYTLELDFIAISPTE